MLHDKLLTSASNGPDMMRPQVSRRKERLTELAVTRVLCDLLNSPLASISKQLPVLERCSQFLEQLLEGSKDGSLCAVADSNNYVPLLSECLGGILRHLGTVQAIQQVTADEADAVHVLGSCLNTVCSGYVNNDETSPSAAKVSSAIEATGMLESLAFVLELAATEVQKQLQKAPDSYVIFLDEPLIRLNHSLLYCWGTALHSCADPLASTAYSSTIIPAATLTARLLNICSLISTSVNTFRLESMRNSRQVLKEAAARVQQCCGVCARFVGIIIMRSLRSGSETTPSAIASNQDVQQLLLLDLGIAVVRLHKQHKGVSPVTVRSFGASGSKDRRIQVKAFSKDLLVALGIPDSCIHGLCAKLVVEQPYSSLRTSLGATCSQLLQLETFTAGKSAASADTGAAGQPAPLPLVQLFLTLVQLAALEPDIGVLEEVLLLTSRIVMESQLYACNPALTAAGTPESAAPADESCDEAVATRLLHAIFDMLLPAVMVAVEWFEKEQQPEVAITLAAAHAELIGRLGLTILFLCPPVQSQYLSEKIFQQDPVAATYVLEAGLRYYATVPAIDNRTPDLDLRLVQDLCAGMYWAVAPGEQAPPAARALTLDHRQRQRLSRQVCSLLLTCNKVASLAASSQQPGPVDKWHITMIGMLTLECGELFTRILLSSPASSSTSVPTVPVEWLVLMARGARLTGMGLRKPSCIAAERIWTAEQLDDYLNSVAQRLGYLSTQLEVLQQPGVGRAAEMLAEEARQSLQQQLEDIWQSAQQFHVLVNSAKQAGLNTSEDHKTPYITVLSEHGSHNRALGERLICFGSEVCAVLPSRRCCNNLQCTNLLRWSEWQLVRGTHCSGCKLAAYCSADCQKQHWSIHKAVCKRLRAAKTVAGK